MNKYYQITPSSPADPKKRDKVKIFTILSIIFGGVMAAGIISLIVFTKKTLEAGNIPKNSAPLTVLIIITAAGAALMSLFLILSLVILIKESKNAPPEVLYTADASVLKDPRIKQLPEVQRLLQYESVQKAFFEGKFPSSIEELADPHLQELTRVLSQYADENGVIRL